MDIVEATEIAEACLAGEAYDRPINKIREAKKVLSSRSWMPADTLDALDWELHIRSVSPARIDS